MKPRKTHTLKIWSEFYNPMDEGKKMFTVRKMDRDFSVGDRIVFEEYDPKTKTFSGWKMQRFISYILVGGRFGIEEGYGVLGLTEKDPEETTNEN